MAKEQFKTMIGGQALIEGIMMRGPKLDAVVVRTKEGLQTEITTRKQRKKGSFATWPLIRGVVNFFDAQVCGVKALMRSADLSIEEEKEEKKESSDKLPKAAVGLAVALGIGMSVVLFFLLPMLIAGLLDNVIQNTLLLNLVEGLVRITIFVIYMLLVSQMKDMKRVFAYHGAEHKTIRCYEAKLPLTTENVRAQTRLHPRCGTSFLLVVMVLSILLFSVATSLLLAVFPGLALMRGSFLYRLILIVCKLMLLPLVVSVAYEINRWAGRHDNLFTRILTAPGMWFQHFTTNEPDDNMIEVGIASLQAVIPEEEGTDLW
ncbi:MAG: DUF1385 domain-containing protein [Oscillospiraceae bacterium]|nr:DUF1385 domain-containing protein [Oscillospiraceae bacterium]